jgi:hypothetical protein
MNFKLCHLLIAIAAIALLFGVGTSYPDKYHYQQRVTIVDGFYAGQEGIIEKRCLFGRYVVAVSRERRATAERRTIFEYQLEPFRIVKPDALLL